MGGRYVLADTRHTSDYESIRIISRYDLVEGVYSRSDSFILILKPTFNTRILCQILTAPVGRVWRLTHFCSVALLLEKWFACHHSFPYFFITIFPTAFYDRSRMTGK